MGRGRGRRDNELIGQTVRISQGPYKGKTEGTGVKVGPVGGSVLMALPPFPRIHWCGEGCNRVHSQGGAALHLSDHLCGPTATNHRVRIFTESFTHTQEIIFSVLAAAVFVHAHDSLPDPSSLQRWS